MDIETMEQQLSIRVECPQKTLVICVNVATEYNNALLVVENNNIGWVALQQCIDRGYENLFTQTKI